MKVWSQRISDCSGSRISVERQLIIFVSLLTGYNDTLRWQIATSGLKEGDLITTTWKIPKIPVKPVIGNSYPLGALPTGTQVCLLQKYHDTVVKSEKDLYFYNENSSGTLLKKVCYST